MHWVDEMAGISQSNTEDTMRHGWNLGAEIALPGADSFEELLARIKGARTQPGYCVALTKNSSSIDCNTVAGSSTFQAYQHEPLLCILQYEVWARA
jgi:hypothetical protein